jgi:hypothetical protein
MLNHSFLAWAPLSNVCTCVKIVPGLKFAIFLPQPHRMLGLQACAFTPSFFFLSFFFLVGLEFGLRASFLQSRFSITWVTPPVHCAVIILEMEILWTIYLGWTWTVILPASQVARITGVSHWCLGCLFFLLNKGNSHFIEWIGVSSLFKKLIYRIDMNSFFYV